MELTVDGLKINYLDIGSKNQQTVLFLHGWGAPVDTYALLTNYLAGFCRVIAPDLPGFGGSDEPRENWDVGDYADFVIAFAKALGLSEAVLMCHSFGGRISIKLLTERELPFTVKKAVFIDAAGIRPKRSLKYYVKVYSYKCMKHLAALPPVAKCCPALVKRVKKNAGSADYRNASERMRAVMVRCIAEDLTKNLPQIGVPVLLIWGELDTATPLADGQKMERLIPDAGLVALAGAGHFSFAERWGQCERVLCSFLKES